MMKNRYLNYHGLRLFFQSLDDFSAFCRKANVNFSMGSSLYSDLFYGTDSEIYVPLWASVAKTGEDVLLNHITLNVIRFYKSYGYEPVHMDGNPADFAGEQLRFAEYISACALNGSMDLPEAEKVLCEFENEFLADTLHMIQRAICRYSDDPSVLFISKLMDSVISGNYFPWDADPMECDSYNTRKHSAIPQEEPHTVSIASNSDCGSKCKLLATVCEGCLLEINPDTDGCAIRFTGCPRGRAYGHTFLTSKRLRYPMERTGERGEGKFRRISWEDAVRKVADITSESGRKYGPGSRFVINAAGVSAAIRGDRFMKNLLALDGGYLDYYNYYSAACALYINPYIYGKALAGNHESTYTDSQLIILWGFNPASCHFGLNPKEYFMRAKGNGAQIIVIDPRMSDSAITMADKWIPIRPSSDTALIDAMAYVIWDEGLEDREFMDRFCIGFDEDHMPEGVPYGESYHSHVFGIKDGIKKTPEWAQPITGIPAETIRELARLYATAKPAALLPGFAPQRTMVGEQACRGFIALACMTGNVGVSGGSTGVPGLKEGHDCPGMSLYPNPYPGKIPVFQWTRAIDAPETIDPVHRGLKGVDRLESGIKVIYSLASGIVINQHSNINDTRRILQTPGKLDALILSDLFMTPSAKFADLLLPAVSFFEMDNIPGTWTAEDYLLYNHQITEPLFGCRFEYDWIREVADIMGLKESFDAGHDGRDAWLRYVYDQCRLSETELPDYDTFRENSCHVFKNNYPRVNFLENIRDGVPFDTPSGKIEIFSKTLYDMGRKDIPGAPGHIYCPEGPEDPLQKKYPLQLIAYHTKRRCHSQHNENPLLEELDPSRIWISTEDARERGINDGDIAEVFNDRGIIRLPAKVTDRIYRGVVAVSEGGWYKEASDGADIGGCINTLTMSDKATPLANGNPQHTNLADVRKYEVKNESN